MRFLSDVLLVVGFGGIAYGVWQMHQPTAFIVGGALLLLAGVARGRAEAFAAAAASRKETTK